MIIRDKATLEGTVRDAAGPGWTSLRLLVRDDGMGFSMTETKVLPGARLSLHVLHREQVGGGVEGSSPLGEGPDEGLEVLRRELAAEAAGPVGDAPGEADSEATVPEGGVLFEGPGPAGAVLPPHIEFARFPLRARG